MPDEGNRYQGLDAKLYYGGRAKKRNWLDTLGTFDANYDVNRPASLYGPRPMSHFADPVWDPFLESIRGQKVAGQEEPFGAGPADDPLWGMRQRIGPNFTSLDVPESEKQTRSQRRKLMQAMQGIGR